MTQALTTTPLSLICQKLRTLHSITGKYPVQFSSHVLLYQDYKKVALLRLPDDKNAS